MYVTFWLCAVSVRGKIWVQFLFVLHHNTVPTLYTCNLLHPHKGLTWDTHNSPLQMSKGEKGATPNKSFSNLSGGENNWCWAATPPPAEASKQWVCKSSEKENLLFPSKVLENTSEPVRIRQY